jgi:glycosyltransferase involved in cell wall biosynthesis
MKDSKKYDYIVFSHLRWEFVTQRPQHIISRLSKDKNILFIEEPIPYTSENKGTVHEITISSNITVVQPFISTETMIEELSTLLKNYRDLGRIKKPITWFYSAIFAPVLDTLPSKLVVYDCMDELAAFKNAPAELIMREKYLLSKADIVFTGGKSLFESKNKLHDNVYCFPSSVDAVHFRKSLDKATIIPDDLKNIPKPTVGFYGVLDERLDIDLLEKIARLAPHISFIMIGPLAKIAQEDLPHLSNIYYLGPKTYEQLPNYLKGIDIAMMPFALNAATQYISPTKTLEFMAALKPIISTAIHDVVRDYKNEITIVKTPEEFISAINKYLNETKNEAIKREKAEETIIKRNSWDATTAKMKNIISTTLSTKKKTAFRKNLSFSKFSLQLSYE